MKLFGIIILIIVLIFTALQLYWMKTNKSIEQHPYTLIKKYKGFETRKYESRLFSSVKLSGNKYETVSGQGFSILAGYIFGGNDKNEKISMTSPVAMSLEDSMTMMFMVPKNLKQEELPNPNNNAIEFVQMPEKKVAAITFSGWANSEKIKEKQQELIDLLVDENIEHTYSFYYLGYNPPYELLNRRNEVIVELK